jgi:thiol-disulfide isomerase/thioredoxin
MACIAVKPIVDGLETEFSDKLRVIRVDIQSEAGKALGVQYDFRFTPTFIFFDAQGKESWREVGSLSAERVRTLLKESN